MFVTQRGSQSWHQNLSGPDAGAPRGRRKEALWRLECEIVLWVSILFPSAAAGSTRGPWRSRLFNLIMGPAAADNTRDHQRGRVEEVWRSWQLPHCSASIQRLAWESWAAASLCKHTAAGRLVHTESDSEPEGFTGQHRGPHQMGQLTPLRTSLSPSGFLLD